MVTYTSSLPEKTMDQLSEIAQQLNIPKNQVIYNALTKYFFDLERQQFIDSFERVAGDEEMKELAEMGMDDYINQLNDLDASM
jgi:uncharacterized protein (DUF4213/DUF364 family)